MCPSAGRAALPLGLIVVLLAAGCAHPVTPAPPAEVVAPAAAMRGAGPPAPTGQAAAPKAAPEPPPAQVTAPAKAAAQSAAAPVPAGVRELITSLEQQYASGVALYRDGQLDEARQTFDATLDRLLSTSYDIRATPALQQELDGLLDRIQALESDVLPTGGLNQAPEEAPPLQRVPELTFPLDAATRARIAAEIHAGLEPAAGQLPLVLNDAVMRYIHYFSTRGKPDLIEGLRRAQRYREMIETIFQHEGVPSDLIYLAQLESDFDPRLVSRAGARGMWQFMPSRAADYGLKRTRWVDQRDDPRLETEAAAHHLKDLHAEFGNWYLAMAAYETGPRTVQELVARTGYADYFKLYAMGVLPRGVRNYVPVILAMALMADNPAEYGLQAVEAGPAEPAVQVRIETLEASVDLRLAADCAQVTVADLQHLNPSLLHFEAPAGYQLRVPEAAAGRFEEGLARVPARERLAWRLHWVKEGETWGQLSRRFHISVARLSAANHLAARHAPLAGTPLALP